MNLDKFQTYLNKTITVLFLFLVIAIVVNLMELEKHKKSPEEIKRILEHRRLSLQKLAEGKPLNENIPAIWPPNMNEEYPELPLLNTSGQEFTIAEFKGKVVIMEFIDMSSPVSQAQSGANLLGPFGITKAEDLEKTTETFAETVRRVTSGSIRYPNPDIIHVKVLVRNQFDGQPTLDDADKWIEHFDIERERDNIIVSVPVKDLRDQNTTDTMLTGFQLIDRKGRLRADSSGLAPKHNLDLTLMRLLEGLVQN